MYNNWRLGRRKKNGKREKMTKSRYHEKSIEWEAESTIRLPISQHVPLTFGALLVDSHRVTAKLSCGDELFNGLLYGFRWLPVARR